jgi:hypothetical protein
MNSIWEQLGLTKNGELPTVKVDVEIDNNSLLKLAGVTFLVGLLLIVISKFAHKN